MVKERNRLVGQAKRRHKARLERDRLAREEEKRLDARSPIRRMRVAIARAEQLKAAYEAGALLAAAEDRNDPALD